MTLSTAPIAPHKQNSVFTLAPRVADWLVYIGVVVCSLVNALVGAYHVNSDTVAYLDLSDAIKNHLWHSVVNAYWFPLYPALLAIGKAFFGYRPQYELMAARLVDAAQGLLFVLASVALAASLRRLMLARGIGADKLLPPRTLYLWVVTFAYFFCSQDMSGITPDALVSSFMILTVAALFWGIAEGKFPPYIAVGLFGGLAFWTKAFAFPFFFLLLLLVIAVNIRKRRVLLRLALSFAVFALIAGSYIWQISAAKGRLTFGESGRLNMAWMVNGSDRLNPVADLTVYRHGTARVSLKHPGELLSKSPEIAYYGGDRVYGSLPQWNDPSYWSDGLSSRFVLHQTLATVKKSMATLGSITVMRFQAVLLVAALCCWGFTIRKPSLADPILVMAFVLAVGCIGSYELVLLEGRYVVFSFVLIGTLFAACAQTEQPCGECRSLHIALLLMAAMVLFTGIQANMREWKAAEQEGARPLQGIYSMPVVSAAAELASIYPRGSEVACMGDAACWADPYWARFAGVKATAVIETGNGVDVKSAEQSCQKLQQNPAALDALRQQHIRAIVSRFDGTQPCSAQWRPLGKSPNFFYLPL